MKIYTIREKGLPVWKVKLDIKGWIVKLFKKKQK
jgi:hypothetical protein